MAALPCGQPFQSRIRPVSSPDAGTFAIPRHAMAHRTTRVLLDRNPELYGTRLRVRASARPGMTATPKRKRTNSRWPKMGINYPANRPDPDCPGGLGAEESGAERTGPTQYPLVAI